MRYYVGQVGRNPGPLHLYPEDGELERPRLETVCPAEYQVGFLRRSDVRLSLGARTVEEWAEAQGRGTGLNHVGRICGHCLRYARQRDHGS